MKLYTSRYQNRGIANTDLIPVGITLGKPRFAMPFAESDHIYMLAPKREWFGLPHDEFTRLYRERLDGYGVEKIRRVFHAISRKNGGRDIVLLCFEDVTCDDPDKSFCHRSVFAQWWLDMTGETVEELPITEGPADNMTYTKTSKRADPLEAQLEFSFRQDLYAKLSKK